MYTTDIQYVGQSFIYLANFSILVYICVYTVQYTQGSVRIRGDPKGLLIQHRLRSPTKSCPPLANHPPCNQNPPNLPNQQKIAQPQNASNQAFLKTGPVRKFKRNLHSLLIANSAEESSLRSITSSPSQCLRFTWPNATVCHCDTI